jgi:hypothetical protein
MHLKALNLYERLPLLSHLLIGPGSIFYQTVCLFSCDDDVQLSQQRFGSHSGGHSRNIWFSIFASRLSSILNLADVADES